MTEPNDHSEVSPAAKSWPARILVAALLIYAVIMLSGTTIVGLWLFDWARERILQSSPLVTAAWSAHPSLPPTGGTRAETDSAAVQEEGAPAASAPVEQSPAEQPLNVLLIGTDARANEYGPPRTDTLILLTLDPTTQTAGMLSLPRDLWVPIPGFDLTYKINTAYAIGEERNYPGGGPQLVKDTVSSFIGQPVQYYVQINFRGFVELLDLIGGVDVNVPKTIHDEAYPTPDYGIETFHLDAGWQHLDGETALKYARTRNVDDDYGRARRQQDLIRAVVGKVTSPEMFATLLAKAPTLLYTMRNSIDSDIPVATQLELANKVRQASLNDIRQLVLDSRYGEETYSDDGAWILLPDRDKVRAAVNEFFRTPVTTSQVGVPVALADPHQGLRIEVLNGTDQPGVAARTRELLQARGWQVVSIGDADRHDYGRTVVINYGASSQVVQEVAAALKLQPGLSPLSGLSSSNPVDLRIVVGNDLLSAIPQ
jgi:LCP family protein required for cell wall assembly